jgi:hypothetical protein
MEDLLHQRCFNHMLREAVARCPECRRYFCRECVTEHEDKVLCAACLGNKINADASSLSRFGRVFFYYLGQILLSLPSSFHEGTLWEMGWWKPQ